MEHQNSIRESIVIGDTGYLKEWLVKIVLEDDYIDNRRHAHQLLQCLEQVAKLQEYKPLAKVEEGNYNKIDELIDTSEKNNKVEYEKKAKGISIKSKLAEKKAEIERKVKHKECESSKKAQATDRTQI